MLSSIRLGMQSFIKPNQIKWHILNCFLSCDLSLHFLAWFLGRLAVGYLGLSLPLHRLKWVLLNQGAFWASSFRGIRIYNSCKPVIGPVDLHQTCPFALSFLFRWVTRQSPTCLSYCLGLSLQSWILSNSIPSMSKMAAKGHQQENIRHVTLAKIVKRRTNNLNAPS